MWRFGPAGPYQIDVLSSDPTDYTLLHTSKRTCFFITGRGENEQGMVLVCDAVLREQKQEENAQGVWLLHSVGESALVFKN